MIAQRSAGQLGQEWVDLAQAGESRTCFIMPYMIEVAGDVAGKRILDLGCGEGGYSSVLSRKGADVVAVDCSEFFIDYAGKQAQSKNLNILHYRRNSNDLHDIEDETFDIVICSMMLMDCEDLIGTVNEAMCVLKTLASF